MRSARIRIDQPLWPGSEEWLALATTAVTRSRVRHELAAVEDVSILLLQDKEKEVVQVAKQINQRSFRLGFDSSCGAIGLVFAFSCWLLTSAAECQGMVCVCNESTSRGQAQKLWETIKTAGRKKTGQATRQYWISIAPTLTEAFSDLSAKGTALSDIRLQPTRPKRSGVGPVVEFFVAIAGRR